MPPTQFQIEGENWKMMAAQKGGPVKKIVIVFSNTLKDRSDEHYIPSRCRDVTFTASGYLSIFDVGNRSRDFEDLLA